MTDPIQQFQDKRLYELKDLLDACLQGRRDPDEEAPNIVGRLREMRFWAPASTDLIEHTVRRAKRLVEEHSTSCGVPVAQQPWGRIAYSAEQLMNEPLLYERDWSTGPIEAQFADALSGWPDVARCAHDALQASTRKDMVDPQALLDGVVTSFRNRCAAHFERLRTPGAEALRDIFTAIGNRSDYTPDMLTAAVTYFGRDGLIVLNDNMMTEIGMIRDAGARFADQGRFDRKDAPSPMSGGAETAGVASKKYDLPDRGDVLIGWALSDFDERVASTVAAEVDRVRLPSGALVPARMPKVAEFDGPLWVLRLLLSGEEICVVGWFEFAFRLAPRRGLFAGRSERKAARKQIEEVHCGKGLEAAVDWALAYAGRGNLPLRVDDLDRSLREFVGHAEGIFGESYLRPLLHKSLRKWRR